MSLWAFFFVACFDCDVNNCILTPWLWISAALLADQGRNLNTRCVFAGWSIVHGTRLTAGILLHPTPQFLAKCKKKKKRKKMVCKRTCVLCLSDKILTCKHFPRLTKMHTWRWAACMNDRRIKHLLFTSAAAGQRLRSSATGISFKPSRLLDLILLCRLTWQLAPGVSTEFRHTGSKNVEFGFCWIS